jgi:hypothetical protein
MRGIYQHIPTPSLQQALYIGYCVVLEQSFPTSGMSTPGGEYAVGSEVV